MTASLFAMVFALWILLKIKLAIFDKEREINRPTLYESFWSLLDFGFGKHCSVLHFFIRTGFDVNHIF